jgi:hypothetical protein
MSQMTFKNQQVDQAEPLKLDRLEYGKLCSHPDGPILSRTVEHRQLGWSGNFSPALARFCEPSTIGVVTRELEDLPRECAHGTVLRPVVVNQRKVIPVICRVGKRPEDGDNHEGRLYTLARYLAAPDEYVIDPLGRFRAMDSERLRGITEDEAARLATIAARRLPPPELDEQAVLFLREALIYSGSGIPIGIAGHIAEETFFKWVAALWWQLPLALRPHLSAGWGVAASLSGQLTITYAEQQSSICAVFSPKNGKWSTPEAVLTPGANGRKTVRENFFRDHVTSGAHYVWYLYGCQPYTLPKIESLTEIPAAEELIPGAADGGYGNQAQVPSFQDPITVKLFCRPGWNAYDSYLLTTLRAYLQYGEGRENEIRQSTLSGFVTVEKKREAFIAACEALRSSEACQRADSILWAMLTQQGRGLFVDILAAENDPRLKLLHALLDGNAVVALEALCQEARLSASRRLPPEAGTKLRKCLTANLRDFNERSADRHEQLLHIQPSLPEDYLEWLKDNGFDLALKLLNWKWEDGIKDCSKIYEHTNSPCVLMLHRMAVGDEPTERDAQVINDLPDTSRDDLGDLLGGKWKQSPKNSDVFRQRLLRWMELAPPRNLTDPLLFLHFSDRAEFTGKVSFIADNVEQRAVPSKLWPAIARIALRRYPDLSERIHDKSHFHEWANAIKFWPEDVALALWPETESGLLQNFFISNRQTSVTQTYLTENKEEAIGLQITAEELERLIKSWLGSRINSLKPSVARWLWHWIVRAWNSKPDSHTPVVHICKYIITGQPLPLKEKINPTDITNAIKLAKLADEHPLSNFRYHELAERWRQSGWGNEEDSRSLFIILQFFPNADFHPTARQLQALSFLEPELKDRLKIRPIDGPNRYAFNIITKPPMDVDYPGDKNHYVRWREDYANTDLWLVFKGVPLELIPEGRLANALRHYCEDDQSYRAKVCIDFLKNYERGELGQAMERVLVEFVIRWLYWRNGLNKQPISEMLQDPHYVWNNREFTELVRLIRRLDQPGWIFSKLRIISKAIDKFFKDLPHG